MAMAGAELMLPPLSILGRYLKAGRPEKIMKWASRQAPSLDVLIISVDMLAYGGLVVSRALGTSPTVAEKRLNQIRALKKRYPRLKIVLFNSIMRLSVTASPLVGQKVWAGIFRYSQLVDKVSRNGTREEKRELKMLAGSLPPNILREYLSTRRRNHQINRMAILLVADRTADFLVLGREDVAPYGLHRSEEIDLRRTVAQHKVSSEVHFMNGTDEIGLMLPIRCLLEAKKKTPKVRVVYSNPKTRNGISLYEDVPLARVVLDHLALLHARAENDPRHADFTLFAHTPQKVQRDLYLDPVTKSDRSAAYSRRAARIFLRMFKGRSAAVADVAYANGGDWNFLQEILPHLSPASPVVYAGWNTSSNTIGTALAAGVAGFGISRSAGVEKARQEFLADRLLDDGFYQGKFRGRKRAHKITKKSLLKSIPKNLRGMAAASSLKFSLPWGRLFEIE